MDSGAFVLGSEVENFEREFAGYTNTRHAVCVNSGTSALHLALLAAGVERGDEIVVPAMTFIATAMAATYIGAEPVCVDVDRFCTMDSGALEKAITSKTKVIMPVHLYGQPADMDPITDVAEKHGIAVIEDAAQAHGAADNGRKCGSLGRVAAWSFYPGKNLGALGEGGAVTTDDDEIAEKCRILRDWGQRGKGNHVEKGFNYRMDAFQGAALGVKLEHIERWTNLRISAADYYREKLARLNGIETLPVRENARCVWHIFPIMVENRDEVAQYLRDAGIGVSVHYPCAVHLHPCYKDLGYKKGDFPNAEKIAENELSLPMFPGITREQIDTVVNALREAVK